MRAVFVGYVLINLFISPFSITSENCVVSCRLVNLNKWLSQYLCFIFNLKLLGWEYVGTMCRRQSFLDTIMISFW